MALEDLPPGIARRHLSSIQRRRRAIGATVTELARVTGFSRPYVSTLLNGRLPVSPTGKVNVGTETLDLLRDGLRRLEERHHGGR